MDLVGRRGKATEKACAKADDGVGRREGEKQKVKGQEQASRAS